MYDQSDLIQNAAKAYGERLIGEQFSEVVNSSDESLRPILLQLRKLYSVDVIERNLGWFLTSGVLPLDVGKTVNTVACKLCKDISPQSLALVEAFGIPDFMLSAPIALDWVNFNERDNQGEVA